MFGAVWDLLFDFLHYLAKWGSLKGVGIPARVHDLIPETTTQVALNIVNIVVVYKW